MQLHSTALISLLVANVCIAQSLKIKFEANKLEITNPSEEGQSHADKRLGSGIYIVKNKIRDRSLTALIQSPNLRQSPRFSERSVTTLSSVHNEATSPIPLPAMIPSQLRALELDEEFRNNFVQAMRIFSFDHPIEAKSAHENLIHLGTYLTHKLQLLDSAIRQNFWQWVGSPFVLMRVVLQAMDVNNQIADDWVLLVFQGLRHKEWLAQVWTYLQAPNDRQISAASPFMNEQAATSIIENTIRYHQWNQTSLDNWSPTELATVLPELFALMLPESFAKLPPASLTQICIDHLIGAPHLLLAVTAPQMGTIGVNTANPPIPLFQNILHLLPSDTQQAYYSRIGGVNRNDQQLEQPAPQTTTATATATTTTTANGRWASLKNSAISFIPSYEKMQSFKNNVVQQLVVIPERSQVIKSKLHDIHQGVKDRFRRIFEQSERCFSRRPYESVPVPAPAQTTSSPIASSRVQVGSLAPSEFAKFTPMKLKSLDPELLTMVSLEQMAAAPHLWTALTAKQMKAIGIYAENPPISILERSINQMPADVQAALQQRKKQRHVYYVNRSESGVHICSLCRDRIDKPVLTNCGHIFCSSCLSQSQKYSKNCPVCRQKVGKQVNLFLE